MQQLLVERWSTRSIPIPISDHLSQTLSRFVAKPRRWHVSVLPTALDAIDTKPAAAYGCASDELLHGLASSVAGSVGSVRAGLSTVLANLAAFFELMDNMASGTVLKPSARAAGATR